MAAVPGYSSLLRWTINYPFIIWRRMATSFFDGTPTPFRWVAAIEPTGRELCTWYFSFTLEIADIIDAIVVTREVLVRFYINGVIFEERIDTNIVFRPRSELFYHFETRAFIPPQMGPTPLTVEIEIRLPGSDRRNGNHPVLTDADASSLSNDLNRVLDSKLYTDMELKSIEDDVDAFKVHSYILEARWTNLFLYERRFRGAWQDSGIINIDIDSGTLTDILTYLYCGKLDTGGQQWRDDRYINQMFHVIFMYDIYHLYRVLLNNDMEQRHEMIREVGCAGFIIKINDLLLLPHNGVIGTTVHENTGYQFLFLFKVHDNGGRWLSYSLVSQTGLHLSVQVSLELVERKFILGTHLAGLRFASLYECDHVLDPQETEDSGPILFLECLQILGDLPNKGPKKLLEETFQYLIRCILKFSDGRESILMGSIFNNVQEYSETCNILCDHMERSLINTFDRADLKMLSFNRPPNQEYQDEIEVADVYMMYKAIFEIRVPAWRRVIEDLLSENNTMPNEVNMTVPSQAVPFIRSYLCTGRVTTIPHAYLDEIENFAITGGCQSLEDLVARARLYLPIEDQ